MVSPGISAQEYLSRRTQILADIRESSAIVLAFAHKKLYTSGSIFHQFHQHPSVAYLSGINEPDVALMLIKSPSTADRFLVFLNEPTKHSVLWEGQSMDTRDACVHFRADEAFDMSRFYSVLNRELSSGSRPAVYADIPTASSDDTRRWSSGDSRQHIAWPVDYHSPADYSPWLQLRIRLESATSGIRSLDRLVASRRLVKSPAEIRLMQRAADCASEAMVEVMRETRDLKSEHDIAALFEYQIKKRGAQKLAYVPVVAGRAANAHTIHYTRNDMDIVRDDLILMDAGAWVDGYCSDITRTFPASGKFSQAQAQVYDALLEVHMDIIKMAQAGSNQTLLHGATVEGIRKLVLEKAMGLSARRSHRLINRLFPHHVSHHLGMDVHDCAAVSDKRHDLSAGMCITIEPGIYIPPVSPGTADLDETIPREFRGISIRIEDDILITASGPPQVLTDGVPKTRRDIEALMNNNTVSI